MRAVPHGLSGRRVLHATARLALVLSATAWAQSPTEGASFLQQHRYPEAMDSFEASLARHPGDAAARQGEIAAATALALNQARGAHPEEALATLGRANAVLPDEPELLLDLGIEATLLERFALADQSLHAALTLRPGDLKTVYALARLETEQQHLPDAERDLKAYLAARPQDASAYFGLGHVYAMEQRPAEARQAFGQSITLQPQQTESYFQLGELALQAHEDADAKAMYAKVLARDPKHAGALTGMGELALRDKAFATAEKFLAEAEASDPKYATPHYFRGLALAKLGRAEEARAELQRGDSRPHATAPTPSPQ